MILDLAQLDHGRLETSFRVPPGSPVLEGLGGEVRESIALDVSVRHPGGSTYLAEAVLSGTLTRLCRRCLAPVDVELDDRFTIVYQVSEEGDTGDDDVIRLEPGAVRIDLAGPVRERLFLETDLYPLCRAECAGFCPSCGRNLNEGSCDCAAEPGEARWAALETLRERVGEEA